MTNYPDSACEKHYGAQTSEPVCVVCMMEEIERLRVSDARYKARRAAIFQMRLRTEIPGYRNWKPTTVEKFNAEYDAACDKEICKGK